MLIKMLLKNTILNYLNMMLGSNIRGKKLISTSNKSLFIKEGTEFVPDNFIHEQN